ncbi:MAG: FecR family protein [Mangrovibacterium sp.]
MDNESIWKQITGKLTGEVTEGQEEAVDQWLASDRLNKGILSRLSEIWNYRPHEDQQDTSGIYRRARERIARDKRKSRFHHLVYYGLRISAIVFLLAGTTVLIRMLAGPGQENPTAFNEIFVPRGSRTSIMLPDSSKVWLANQSKLTYPGNFQGDLREVELTGEAYFEVVRQDSKPLVVRFGKHRIRVFGTKFSVTAYPEDQTVKAELISGKVTLDIQTGERYQSVEMKPGQSLSYNEADQTITEGRVDAGFYDYWLKGVYTFKDETLESLARKTARIYNMEIIFRDEQLKSKRYSGSFSVDDNLYNFIEAIRQTSVDPIGYKVEKNKLYLYLTKN